jgi:hypothetical protein
MRLPAVLAMLTLSGCATAVAERGEPPAPESEAEARRICWQRMQAARAGGMLTVPDRHQVRMCLKRKGYEAT